MWLFLEEDNAVALLSVILLCKMLINLEMLYFVTTLKDFHDAARGNIDFYPFKAFSGGVLHCGLKSTSHS